jgi:hypothetical protein
MKNTITRIALTLSLFFLTAHVFAQDDLLKMLEQESASKEKEPVTATFKSTRLINGHSIENNKKGVLQFMILHRFGDVNGGSYEFFGLDEATMRLGFDYGVTDWLNIGVGRSTFEKTYDGLIKIKWLRQKKGGLPFTVTSVSTTALKSVKFSDPERKNYFSSRMYYTQQVLIGSKVTDALSLQLMPTLIHRNLVANTAEQNDVYALGGGGRIKLSRSITFNAEYYYVFPDQLADGFTNSFSVGFDIETGGHVFQLHFTNSRSMVEKGFVAETTGDWKKGDIRFGFNLNRVFTVYNPGRK